jgi:Ca2+-binding EF-hand superfamily protein
MNLAREEQLAALKKRVREMFVIFEHKEGAKMILASDIANVPRAMGYNLTSVQEQQLQQKLEMAAAIDDANHIALEHYEGVAASWIMDNMDALRRDDLHTILRAFRTLDNDDKGYVQTETLQVGVTVLARDVAPGTLALAQLHAGTPCFSVASTLSGSVHGMPAASAASCT